MRLIISRFEVDSPTVVGRSPILPSRSTDKRWSLPQSAYYMSGAGSQRVFIIPTHDLVVVRLGHRRGKRAANASMDAALKKLLEVVPVAKQ